MKTRDIDLRTSLNSFLIDKFSYDKTTRIVHELNVCYGSARADVAAINGLLHGYEIKSESDTLERLPQQMEQYNKVFDNMTIVCCDNFISQAEKLIPKWWGIYIASYNDSQIIELDIYRKPEKNDNVDAFSISQFLQKAEIIQILIELGADKKISRLPKYVLWEELSKNCPLDLLKDYVRFILKHRNN